MPATKTPPGNATTARNQKPAPPGGTPAAPSHNRGPVHNRIRTLMLHAPRYAFQGQARLARDAGVSRSTVSRLVTGRLNPSYRLTQAVTAALERALRRPLDPRELLSPDGTYPTPSGCALCGCKGCLPDEAYAADGSRRPEWRDAKPGEWSVAPPTQSADQDAPQQQS